MVVKTILREKQYLSTASPHLTRILGPEKKRVRQNRTIGGLWEYTIQNF